MHSENTTFGVSLVASSFYFSQLSNLQVVSFSHWKTMYRTNTKNVNNKLNVIKCH